MINILTFNVLATAVIIFVTWFLNEVLPQVLYNRKLDRTAKLAEESRRRYLMAQWSQAAARSNEVTKEIRVPAFTEG